jgi:dTDP-4-amino-4,6-dideoxygalactose transaminase
MNYPGRKVLISGGAGLTFSAWVCRLIAMAADVTLVDSLIPEYGGNLRNLDRIASRLVRDVSDVPDAHRMKYLVPGRNIAFDLGGQTGHTDSVTGPFADLEITGHRARDRQRRRTVRGPRVSRITLEYRHRRLPFRFRRIRVHDRRAAASRFRRRTLAYDPTVPSAPEALFVVPPSNHKANYLAHRGAIDTAITRVLESGWYILGEQVTAFKTEFSVAISARCPAGVANETDALKRALRAPGVCAGDAVITVSPTAVATASAIGRIGAQPAVEDADQFRHTVSRENLATLLTTPSGRAAKFITVVHLVTRVADMDALMALTDAHGRRVIEDCAQSHGTVLRGRPASSASPFVTYGIHRTKNLVALGDGDTVCGTDDTSPESIRLLFGYGRERRHSSDGFGFSWWLDELVAAALRAKLPARIDGSDPVFHRILVQTTARDGLSKLLLYARIGSRAHYRAAAHQQAAFPARSMQRRPLPATKSIIPRILSLAMSAGLTDAQVDATYDAIRRWSSSRP